MTELDSNQTSSQGSAAEKWERDLLSRLVLATLTEQRRARRWSVFFKSLLFVYLFGLLFIALSPKFSEGGLSVGSHTALVDVDGVIASDSDANADTVIEGLRAAFKDKGTKGVILRINSPGGSPVQAGQINDAIYKLRAEHPGIPMYTVITDLCASGGYYVAVAADKIYADKASLVGSIGVLMDGFGFVESLNKLGVERRLYTAGAHKGYLDPFSPSNEVEVQHTQKMLEEIHRQFIDTVKKGRGARLKDDPDIFSGLIWTGEQGVALGLVDGLGSSEYVARELIHEEDIVDFTQRRDYIQRFAQRMGAATAKGLLGAVTGVSNLR